MSVGTTHFNILLVDDEPDVLSISKLAMRNFTALDLPLNIQTATSKAETIELLNQEQSPYYQLAVAFIDVVMETDTAGLELCQYIREVMKNRRSQLYIRTGQPGIAPERAVIDKYDISGYFTKAEMTEDKLYSLVKSGVRQFMASSLLEDGLGLLYHLVDVGDSKQQIKAVFANVAQSMQPANRPDDNAVLVAIDDEPVWGPIGWDMPTALAMKKKLDTSEGTPLSPDGDKHIMGEEDGYNTLLLKVAARPPRPEVYAVLKFREEVQQAEDNRSITTHNLFRTIAALWARAE